MSNETQSVMDIRIDNCCVFIKLLEIEQIFFKKGGLLWGEYKKMKTIWLF